jgi:hypothetical protein
LGFGIWDLGIGVWGLGFGVWDLGFGIWGFGIGVWGLGFGVWGLELRPTSLGRLVPYHTQAIRVHIRDPSPLRTLFRAPQWSSSCHRRLHLLRVLGHRNRLALQRFGRLVLQRFWDLGLEH